MDVKFKIYTSVNDGPFTVNYAEAHKAGAELFMRELKEKAKDFSEHDTFVYVKECSDNGRVIARIVLDAIITLPGVGYKSIDIENLHDISQKLERSTLQLVN